MAESVENRVILSSSSKWKIGSDELFVTCLNCDSENKLAKSMKNCLDLFINTSLINMSIRSCLVSQPKDKFISNGEKLFNATDLSPITFGVILPPNPHSINSTKTQINPGTSDENKNLKYILSKYN